MDKIKSVSSVTTQVILRNLGSYASSYLGNDMYFLLEAINWLKSDFGEDELRKIFEERGKEWGEVKLKLQKMNELSTQIKIFYDPIQNKNFEKKDVNPVKVQSVFKNYFKRTVRQLTLLNQDIYDVLIILLKNTSVGRATIPSDAFKVIEHTGMRKMGMEMQRRESILKE